MNVPVHLKYTKNDEWINVDGKTGVIGITDFAQSQLSDIVFVEVIVAVGESVHSGDICATVESVKAAAEVYAPVSGAVIEVNEGLSDTPEVINSDPYGKAWMVKIELSDPSELSTLLDPEAYLAYCQERVNQG